MKSRPLGNVSVAATLGGQPVFAGRLAGKTVRIRRATVPLDVAHPPAGPLTIAASGGERLLLGAHPFPPRAGGPEAERQRHRGAPRIPRSRGPTRQLIPREGIKVGDMVRVRVTVSPDAVGQAPLRRGSTAGRARGGERQAGDQRRRTQVARRWAAGGASRSDLDESWWSPAAREVRDDRVIVFIDQLYPGPASFTYLARATTAGTYVVPGASAGEMYEPAVERPHRAAHLRGARQMRRRLTRPRARCGVAGPGAAGDLVGGGARRHRYPRARLEPRAAASLTVLDAAGGILRQDATAAGGRESWVPLERVVARSRERDARFGRPPVLEARRRRSGRGLRARWRSTSSAAARRLAARR